MLEATDETTTNKNPDAAIFEMGDRLAELDRQCLEFDSASARLRRRGRLSESKEASVRMDEAYSAYSDLEWRLVYTPAATPEGHWEKIRILERGGFSFGPDVVAEIMWMLACEAAAWASAIPSPIRVSACSPPPRRQRRRRSAPGSTVGPAARRAFCYPERYPEANFDTSFAFKFSKLAFIIR
jgi:hypothetical protein